MKVHRIIEYTPAERTQLLYLKSLADTERLFRQLRRKAMRDAVALGLPTRLVGDFAGMSAAEVSRVSSGLRP